MALFSLVHRISAFDQNLIGDRSLVIRTGCLGGFRELLQHLFKREILPFFADKSASYILNIALHDLKGHAPVQIPHSLQ